jgi:hypothetical protein
VAAHALQAPEDGRGAVEVHIKQRCGVSLYFFLIVLGA